MKVLHQMKIVANKNLFSWSDENLQLIQEQRRHVPKPTVWCAVTTEMIICPNFFEVASGSAIMVTGETSRICEENIYCYFLDLES